MHDLDMTGHEWAPAWRSHGSNRSKCMFTAAHLRHALTYGVQVEGIRASAKDARSAGAWHLAGCAGPQGLGKGSVIASPAFHSVLQMMRRWKAGWEGVVKIGSVPLAGCWGRSLRRTRQGLLYSWAVLWKHG